MRKDAYYFSHDSNAQDDPKCMLLIDQLGMEGYGIFWALVERLRNEKEYKLPINVVGMLAKRWCTSKEKVESVIKNYGLFVIENEIFYSDRLKHSMLMKSDKAKISATNRWGNSVDLLPAPFEYSSTRSQRMSEARKKGTHKKQEWMAMREWFGQCVKCGTTEDILKDHIIPIYQGGDDSLSNLQPLCRSCNGGKGRDNQDYRVDFCLRNACEMPAAWLPMSANKESKIKEKKEKKGVSFSEDLKQVVFDDGSSQLLGQRQLQRMAEGGYQPHYITKGVIE